MRFFSLAIFSTLLTMGLAHEGRVNPSALPEGVTNCQGGDTPIHWTLVSSKVFDKENACGQSVQIEFNGAHFDVPIIGAAPAKLGLQDEGLMIDQESFNGIFGIKPLTVPGVTWNVV